jgi:hypothetical protein
MNLAHSQQPIFILMIDLWAVTFQKLQGTNHGARALPRPTEPTAVC